MRSIEDETLLGARIDQLVSKLRIVGSNRFDLICLDNALFIYPRLPVFLRVLEQHVGGGWWCDLSHGPFSLKPLPTVTEF